jgi:hypothetical protein
VWATTVVTAIAVVNAKAMARARKIFFIDSHPLPETLPSCAISAQGLCVRDHKKAVSGKRRYSEYSSEVAQAEITPSNHEPDVCTWARSCRATSTVQYLISRDERTSRRPGNKSRFDPSETSSGDDAGHCLTNIPSRSGHQLDRLSEAGCVPFPTRPSVAKC